MSFDEFITADKLEETSDEVFKNEVEVVEEVQHKPVPVKLDLEESGELPDYAILNPNIGMDIKLKMATKVANTLAPIIRDQGLVKTYGKDKKEYVLIEGWNTLGTLLGITPITRSLGAFESATGRGYGYRAEAILVQNAELVDGEVKFGNVLARAEAIDTKNGNRSAEEDIYSMAQTKALGKAYRSALSWIIKMAGFQPTPAEEMENFK